MGTFQSKTTSYPWDYKNIPPNPVGDYDAAGWIPTGMTYTPQASWDEAFNYGGAQHMRNFKQHIPGLNGATDWGATEGLLTSFGTIGTQFGYPKLYDTNDGMPQNATLVDGEFVSVKVQPQPYASWKYGNCVGSNCNLAVCTPERFPACSMTSMIEAGGEASFYDHKTQNAGRIYSESVDRAYHNAFLGGGIEALDLVNTNEHSTFDPCSSPSLFEVLLPLFAAATACGAYSYYGKPEVSVGLGSNTAEAGTIVIAGFVYNYSKGLLEYFNEPTNKHFENAARFLLYPIGLYGGAELGNAVFAQTDQSANPQYFTIGGALAGAATCDRFLVVPTARALAKGGFLGTLILGSFGFVMRTISGAWCRFTTNQDSCAAVDLEEYQDSRRWDAVSIAAKLTLEACEREGWQKDSAEAQFVFRGLLSGPSLMETPILGSEEPSIFDQTLANPLGYIYAGRWQQQWGNPAHTEDNTWIYTTKFARTNDIFGWDGEHAGFGDLANLNLYSCENWDVLREGKQQKTHPKTQAVKARFDKWIGSWQDPGSPVGTLVAAAKIPANIEAMKHIPGWELESATTLYTPLKVAAPEIPNTNLPLDPTPPREKETLEVLPFYLDYPALTLGLQAPFKRLDIAPPHQKPPTLEVLPFVEINDCAVTWRDEIMSGNSRWANLSAAQVQQAIEQVLAANNCNSCDVEDRGKLEALRVALSGSQALTCTEFAQVLQHFGWTPLVIQHAIYTVARTQDGGIDALRSWVQQFLADCTNYDDPGAGFAALPTSITSTWCT